MPDEDIILTEVALEQIIVEEIGSDNLIIISATEPEDTTKLWFQPNS